MLSDNKKLVNKKDYISTSTFLIKKKSNEY